MAEPTALATVAPVAGAGMVQLRCDLGAWGAALADALQVPLPGRTAIAHRGERSLGWMSPDELLLVLPAAEVPAAIAAAGEALAEADHLIADVSAMRCVFDLRGEGAWQVLAKLSPTDFGGLPPDALRRTRLAQVACAFWRIEGGFRVIAFRSVADYVRRALDGAAASGTWLDPR